MTDEKRSRGAGRRVAFRVAPDQLGNLGFPRPNADDQTEETPSDEPREELEECIVNQGHSIHTAGTERTIVGYDADDGVYIYRRKSIPHGPNEKVMLPRSEAKRLRECGFIRDESKIAPAAVFDAQQLKDTMPGLVSSTGNGSANK